jgi:hypothetical protein
MKSILDPSFRYVSSSNTDIRKTFARVRRQQKTADRVPVAAARKTPLVLLDDHRKSVA